MHFWHYRNYTNVQETAKFNSTNCAKLFFNIDLLLKVIYHPLYGMNNYVLIWGDWLSCDPLGRVA